MEQRPSSDYLQITTDSAIDGNAAPISTPAYPSASNFLPVDSVIPSTTTAAAAPSDFLSVVPSESPPTISPTPNPSDDLPVNSEYNAPFTSNYLTISSHGLSKPYPTLTDFLSVIPGAHNTTTVAVASLNFLDANPSIFPCVS